MQLKILSPFSEVYFALDQNANRKIEPKEMQRFFKALDVNNSGVVRKVEWQRGTDSIILETCYEMAKVAKKMNCKGIMPGTTDKACLRRRKRAGRRLGHQKKKQSPVVNPNCTGSY